MPSRARFFARAGAVSTPPLRAQVDTAVRDNVATLRLYDVIDSWGGEWGVSASDFAAALGALPPVDSLRLHINSPGGEVFEGVAIHSLLTAFPAPVTVVVDSLAASAASFVAMAGDTIEMTPYAQMMIHDAWGYAVGNAADMRDLANRLDHLSDTSAQMYADRAGGDVATWRAAMQAETWFSAQEAVDAGLADRIAERTAAGGEQMAYDLSQFRWHGRAEAPAPAVLRRQAEVEPVEAVEPDPALAVATASRLRALALLEAALTP